MRPVQMLALITVITLGSFYTLPSAQAASLKDILESKSIERMDRENRALDLMSRPNNRRPVSPWLNTNTNFGKIMTNKYKPDAVLHWIFGAVQQYRAMNPKFLRERETSSYTTPLSRGKKRRVMEFRLVIPHPKFRESRDYGLVKQFNQLIPAERLILSKKEVTVGKARSKATVYELKRNQCIVLIDAAKGSVIQLLQQKCENTEEIIRVADKIDISRLNRKLNS